VLYGSSVKAWKLGFASSKLRGEVEVDEAYVPLGCKGRRQAWPRRRGGGRRRGRCTGRKKPFFTLVERGSRRALFLAEGDASGRTVATVLLGHVKRGSTVYTDEFRGYRRVSGLGYEHLSVRHSSGVYAAGPVHVNGAESRNWLLRAFPFFKRGISLFHASFYAFAASAFVRLYAERPFSAFHWLLR